MSFHATSGLSHRTNLLLADLCGEDAVVVAIPVFPAVVGVDVVAGSVLSAVGLASGAWGKSRAVVLSRGQGQS